MSLINTYWIPISLLSVLLYLCYNKYGKGLTNVPGPTAASFTKLWRLRQVAKGRFHEKQIALHRKYGKAVRIAPGVVSIGDPAAIPIIYGLKQDFTKTGFYPIQAISWKKKPEMNIFSERDPAEHREEKKKVSSAYSLSNLLQSEPKVDSCTELFKSRLDEWAKDGKPIDLSAWLQYCKCHSRRSSQDWHIQ